MHLVDHARAYIEQNYKRPLSERLLRSVLAKVLPYPTRFRLVLLVQNWRGHLCDLSQTRAYAR